MSSRQPLLFFAILLLSGCATAADSAETSAAGTQPAPPTRVVDLRQLPPLERIIPELAEKRVVFVGESHDRYSHHLNQLAIIRGIHQRHPELMIGLEFFQQPYQEFLDAYVAGTITEQEMLRRTEYYERWKFDYRLYRPILQYARDHGLRLVALNIPAEITRKVAREGLGALSPEERAQLPDLPDADPAYRERLRKFFAQHPNGDRPEEAFENFVRAQLVWDEGMAERAANALRSHPDHRMVILAGSGHLAYGAGIPSRLERRIGVETALVLNGAQETLSPDLADFILLPEPVELPEPGRLGILMNEDERGVFVQGFAEASAAEAAGVRKGDYIVELAGEAVNDTSDVRIALLDHRPGTRVDMVVRRENWLGEDERAGYTVALR